MAELDDSGGAAAEAEDDTIFIDHVTNTSLFLFLTTYDLFAVIMSYPSPIICGCLEGIICIPLLMQAVRSSSLDSGSGKNQIPQHEECS